MRYQVYAQWTRGDVLLTEANQLVGTYDSLRRFYASEEAYKGWEVHHVVEDDDLKRLGVNGHAPAYNNQLCVLLPKSAHSKRITSRLRHFNPTRLTARRSELRSAYADAYGMMGDYCGGGEAAIKREFLAIVDAEFQKLGVR